MMEKPHVCSRDLDSRLQKDKGEGGGRDEIWRKGAALRENKTVKQCVDC